jgi:hypothetical protein
MSSAQMVAAVTGAPPTPPCTKVPVRTARFHGREGIAGGSAGPDVLTAIAGTAKKGRVIRPRDFDLLLGMVVVEMGKIEN